MKTGAIDKEFVDNAFLRKKKDLKSDDSAAKAVDAPALVRSPYPKNFLEVERAFSQAMLMYRSSVIETIRIAPVLASIHLGEGIEKVCKTRGAKVDALSEGEVEVYSLPEHALSAFMRYSDRARALIDGADHLPAISAIGILSSYDAILSDLLKVVFSIKPEMIFTSDREIKFSDLAAFGSISEARDSIVSNEIDGVMRQSHHEQFSWMEKKFAMKLTEGLDVWPEFVELCERRNLLTHTGGVVSGQYLKNCEHYGKPATHSVGDKLEVDLDYLKRAVEIVSEIGFKLIHTLWRKFAPRDLETSDSTLNACGMNLIASKEYSLAEKLLSFGVYQKRHHSDRLKRMMIVNLANSAKLQGHQDRCNEQLASHDWSATSYQFQISVAAVKNDFPGVARLLMLGGDVIELSSSDFRDWPVFGDARKDAEVQTAFEKVYGEPLNKHDPVDAPPVNTEVELVDGEEIEKKV